MRIAGARFDGPYALRSPAFEALAERYRKLECELGETAESLVETIYALVPTSANAEERRKWLACKRAVFNRRPLPESLPEAPRSIERALREFEVLRERWARLIDALRPQVLEELDRGLRVLSEDRRFRLACRYASPALAADLRSTDAGESLTFSSLGRGLYAYAARFISKANPFHLFAGIAFTRASGLSAYGGHEVVVDFGPILALERELTTRSPDAEGTWLELAPVDITDRCLSFWAPAENGLRLVPVERDPRVDAVLGLFLRTREATGSPVLSQSQWSEFLRAEPSRTRAALAKRLSDLLSRGVVRRYRVTDPTAIGEALRSAPGAREDAIKVVTSRHLSRCTSEELPEVHEELTRTLTEMGWEGTKTPPFFVNTFCDYDGEALEFSLRPLRRRLDHLKPVLLARHNFEGHARVIRAYVFDLLTHLGGPAIPYLRLLRHYLAHRAEIIERYRHHPTTGPRRDEPGTPRPADFEGNLSEADLRTLAPDTAAAGATPSACFIGPFDPLAGVFYLSNVFAGGDRYLGRFVMAQERPGGGVAADDDTVHADLMVPPPPSLNLVPTHHAVGCGFQARWSHRYKRWIDPGELWVGRRGADLEYRWGCEGPVVRLHYRGLQIAEHLPAQYHLLLPGHADSFVNPFLREVSSRQTQDVVWTPGLRYGEVCLRRESWSLRREALMDLLEEKDSLRFALDLGRRLREMTRCDERHWYFTAPGVGRRAYKPRYLDLGNPMSTFAFRRSLERASARCRISFAKMRPGPKRLLAVGGEPHVTELMLEV